MGAEKTRNGGLSKTPVLPSAAIFHDKETGLYYLQSRYYNPENGRFLNADAYAATGQGFVGNNMFAYCNNNPVTFKDPSGLCREVGALLLITERIRGETMLLTQQWHFGELVGISMRVDVFMWDMISYPFAKIYTGFSLIREGGY